ncbi:MAG: bacteriohemerythrin [Proteobacteria bacterium]|nr:bacteriohemerythrin [Pseudomonadota bacterium]
MPKLSWSPSLSLGVDIVDKQHQQLVEIANTLIEAVEKGHGQEVVNSVIQSLREYTVHHFHDEEQFMADIHYPKRGEHAAQHAELVRLVKDFQHRLYIKEIISGEQIKAFLKSWLLEHILEHDLDIGQFVRSKEAPVDESD